VTSLQIWGGFGWMDGRTDGVGCLTRTKRSASSWVAEAQEGSWPGHADPTMSHHMASTVTHHAGPTTSHHAAPTTSHHAAPTPSHHAGPTTSHHTAPSTSHRGGPTTSHHAAPSTSYLPQPQVALRGSLPAVSTSCLGLCNLRLKGSVFSAEQVGGFCLQMTGPLTFVPCFHSPPTFKHVTHCWLFY